MEITGLKVCIFLIVFSYVRAKSQKSITVQLDAKWLDTPLYLEASEYLAEDSPDYFWKYVESIVRLGPGALQQKTAKQQYEVVIDIASKLLSPPKLAFLKFSFALRVYSPTIEMFHQIAKSTHFPSDCDSVAQVGGDLFICDPEELKTALASESKKSHADTYQVDHHYPGSTSAPVTVILYSEIGTPSFIELHQYLKSKAEKKEVDYVLRHYIRRRSNKKVKLSGYGVELAIKSTEYKAQDDTQVKDEKQIDENEEEQDKPDEVEGFIFTKLHDLYPEKKTELENFKNFVLDSTKEVATLKVWELQELSLQAAQKIISSPVEESLKVMQDIAQNFPTQARSLVHISVKPEIKKEIDKNQQMFMQHHNLAPSDVALFINGMYFDMEITDVFSLVQVLKQETKLLEGLHNIGIPEVAVSKLLKLDMTEDKVDYAVDIRDSAVMYVNDIESDKQYRNWPSSIHDLLRPSYPGMLRNVRKNIYHLVIVADPSQSDVRDIYRLAESFYVHKAPVRIGLVFAVNSNASVDGFSDPGVALLNSYNFIAQDKTAYEGLSFITDVYVAIGDKDITVEDVTGLFKSRYPSEDMDIVFGIDSDYDTGRKLAWDFIERTGIGSPPQVLINGVPLKKKYLNGDMFEEAVLSEIMRQTPFIQKSVYKGDLSDHEQVIDFLMAQKNVMPRLNQKILSSDGTYLDLTGRVVEDLTVEDFSSLNVADMATTFSAQLKYITKRVEGVYFHPLTVWIAADYDLPEGRALFASALAHLKTSQEVRLGVIFNPTIPLKPGVISKAIHSALSSLEQNTAKLFINKLLKEANIKAIEAGNKTLLDFAVSNMNTETFLEVLESDVTETFARHSTFSKNVLGLSSGRRAVVANGRVYGPFDEEEKFSEDDFSLLEKYSMNTYGTKLGKELKSSPEMGRQDSELLMKAASLLLANPPNRVRHDVKFYSDKQSVITIPAADSTEPAHEVLAVVDPVSRGAQKLAPLLMVLKRVINAKFRIFMNCVEKHSNMPLKSFFRLVLEPEPVFSPEEELGEGPVAIFSNMPTSPLLTLAMVTPENWLVEVIRSPYDLDNIHLEQVESHVYAEFELEHLLLEGHCFEQSSGNPPRGLQFTLGTNSTPVMVDTIVMANLGYFQLKAEPGAWLLRLRQGRSSDIYEIVSHEGTDSPPGSKDVAVIISNFRSHVIKVRVNKKSGKLHQDLLNDDDDSDNGGIWNSITSMPVIGGIVAEWRNIWNEIYSKFSGEKKDKDEEEEDKLNIFSLASGHLYERLLRIMMLSVIKNTKTPVKFWFLKNYLSPNIKDFLPYMSKKYGFEYELVQYKWPRWLNQQTEKQRIIWGYKILFLDVLFPLDVKKIIFVDADQVVRADLKELRDLDLGRAPYGYTPFCESRRDMDGYRFWKSGYWASHLGNRKYHISALYVVDLKKFRRIAAGDRLRGQYQGLSQDPNSLSNLDQDLPNNMIHQVNIKSLPQEWLWCETWCDDESKQYAKTIDLCNNPKTKESKLVSARRIIPEWSDYDDEIKQLFEAYLEEKQLNETQLLHKTETSHSHVEL
ncbi:UDP-glucose-glycoprotein glucosyltransferase isoform X3 [Tachypleus tridentatus]